jgi:hypothetical protein
MTSTVYDPSKNIVRIAGHVLVGVTDIRVNRGNDLFKTVDGIDPLYSARIKNFKRPFKLFVKLLQTSESNSVLQYLSTSSEVTYNSFFRVEVLSQGIDGKSKTNISSTGYVLSSPDLSLATDTNDMEWIFAVNAFDFSGLTDLIDF